MGTAGRHVQSDDGVRIFRHRWDPPGRARAAVCIVHGIGEHGARYADVAARMCDAGYVVSALDLRGHGRSDGRRGDARFHAALNDVGDLVADASSEGLPVFLYGHSLGGLLALLYSLRRPAWLAGVVATGPALHTALREQRLKVGLARLLGRLLPSVTVPSGLDDTKLNRDPAVIEAYRADPLVHDRASLGFALDALVAIDEVLSRASELSLPLLLVHGGRDDINRVSGSEEVARKVAGGCTLKVYDGLFHAVEHEPERDSVIDDVIAWMDHHVAGSSRIRGDERPQMA